MIIDTFTILEVQRKYHNSNKQIDIDKPTDRRDNSRIEKKNKKG